jgi:hypothetical protein
VEGLLKKVSRGRLSVPQLKEMEYVRQGIHVEGGLRRLHDDEFEGEDLVETPFGSQRPSLSRAHTFADLHKADEEEEEKGNEGQAVGQR